jgi:Acyl-CoA carboxylase epsilon subunit
VSGADAAAGEPVAEQALDLRVTAGRPTDEELAAVTAVLHAAVAEQAAHPEPLVVPDGRHWQRANGFLRGPLTPGPREWRSF